MRKLRTVLALLLSLALLTASAAWAEGWEYTDPNWPEVYLTEGDTVVLSGNLVRNVVDFSSNVFMLELDQPLDIYMNLVDGSMFEAMLSSIQVLSMSDISSMQNQHVMVMANIAINDGTNATMYGPIVLNNAAVTVSSNTATVAGAEVKAPAAAAAPVVTAQVVEATGTVNIRKGPGLGYATLGSITAGERLTYMNDSRVDERGVIWYKVQFGSGSNAWISSTYSHLVSSASASAPSWSAPVATSGDYVQATGGQSNLRSGPGLAYSEVGVMLAGATATYLNQASVDDRGVVWYYISYNGKNAWVSSRYTTLRASYSSGIDWSKTTAYVEGTARVSVRSGPGVEYEGWGTLVKGERVVYTNVNAMDATGVLWYQVQYYGYGIGWVSSVYSRVVMGGYGDSGVASTDYAIYGTYVQATGGKSTLREGPGLGYDDLHVTVQRDEIATYLNQTSIDERGVRWYYVNFNGTIGWISSRYTTLY